MCVLGLFEPVDSVLTFPSGYDTLEYSWVKATTVSVRLRISFVTLQSTNILPLHILFCPNNSMLIHLYFTVYA